MNLIFSVSCVIHTQGREPNLDDFLLIYKKKKQDKKITSPPENCALACIWTFTLQFFWTWCDDRHY